MKHWLQYWDTLEQKFENGENAVFWQKCLSTATLPKTSSSDDNDPFKPLVMENMTNY